MSSTGQSTTGVVSSLKLQYVDSNGNTQNLPFPIPVDATIGANGFWEYPRFPTPASKWGVKYPLWRTHFGALGSQDGGFAGWSNDGQNASFLDTLIPFNGYPSLRLNIDASSHIAGPTPGTIPAPNNFNITKRRIAVPGDVIAGKYWKSFWCYISDTGQGGDTILPISQIYNRDGTNRVGGGLWFDIYNHVLRVITTGNSWGSTTGVYTKSGDWGQSTGFRDDWGNGEDFSTSTGGGNAAGAWHYIEYGLDFGAASYLYAIIDGTYVDLSTNALYTNADNAARVLHFSFETGILGTGGKGWWNVAEVSGGTFY